MLASKSAAPTGLITCPTVWEPSCAYRPRPYFALLSAILWFMDLADASIAASIPCAKLTNANACGLVFLAKRLYQSSKETVYAIPCY